MNGAVIVRPATTAWTRTALALIVGYALMGRSFAYLGIPPWNLFIGEIVLALFLLAGPRAARGSWPWLARWSKSLRSWMKSFLLLFAYGLLQVAHGIAAGYSALTAVRDLAFNYYPIFFLLGLTVGLHRPDLPRRFFRILAWFNGLYGVAYVLILNRLDWTFPGVSRQVVPVPIFGFPEFSFVILLALLAYEPDLTQVWHLLFLNTFVLLGMQIRAEWAGLAAGLLLWAWITKNLKRVLAGAGVVAVVLALMVLFNFSVPGIENRGGADISARDLVGRALAPLNADLASNFTSSYKSDEGTAVWRTVWWAEIFLRVHQTPQSALLGLGYGYPIGDLSPYIEGDFIQTPHNVFFYALGYTGWIGVLLFALFQKEVFRILWRAYRCSGLVAGLILWVAMLVFALFTPFFEVPQGAIPFYLVLGCIAGASFSMTRRPAPAVTALPIVGQMENT